jgi:hypothetical protein
MKNDFDNFLERCRQCSINEREIENIRKDIEEIKIDMRVFQRMNQEMEIKFGKLETFITEKFLQMSNKLDEITVRMDEDKAGRKNSFSLFIGQFILPLLAGAILAYIAIKLK